MDIHQRLTDQDFSSGVALTVPATSRYEMQWPGCLAADIRDDSSSGAPRCRICSDGINSSEGVPEDETWMYSIAPMQEYEVRFTWAMRLYLAGCQGFSVRGRISMLPLGNGASGVTLR